MTERNRAKLDIRDFIHPNTAGNYGGVHLHPRYQPVGILGGNFSLPLACDPPTIRNLGGRHPLI